MWRKCEKNEGKGTLLVEKRKEADPGMDPPLCKATFALGFLLGLQPPRKERGARVGIIGFLLAMRAFSPVMGKGPSGCIGFFLENLC